MNAHVQNIRQLPASTIRNWLEDGDEIAFIDVREESRHGWGHPLLSVSIPYSRLEASIAPLVPSHGTRIALIDDGDGIAEKAAARLSALGYRQIVTVEGGVEGWRDAGFILFEGVNVPSKSFAEVVEHAYGTPDIDATDLKALLDAKADVVVLDSRTEAEFERFHVPGAISVPSAELVYRFNDLVPSPDTLVVISCAGRTRGILGAQTVINAGVPNRVVALNGGTQGWRLADLDIEKGARTSAAPSPAARQAANARASALAKKHGIGWVDHDELPILLSRKDGTTYVFDIRTPAEYEAGHLSYARSIPGGQLLQTLDEWAAVRHARIVLVDDDGIRATITAHWVKQLGWDVVVLAKALEGAELVKGPEKQAWDVPTKIQGVAAPGAQEWLGEGGRIVSVSSSADFRKGHPQGALWSIRPKLSDLPQDVLSAPRILVTGTDDAVAALAALDLSEIASGEVRVLEGGDAAWQGAGLPWGDSPNVPADADRHDFLTWNFDRHLGNPAASRAYLAWEHQLPAQIESDGSAGFRIPTT